MSEQTRRDWVLSIGHAAIGVGVAWKAASAESAPADLPPGVYLPSRHDLGHALMSADRYHPVPPGCPTDYVRPRTGPYQRLFLSDAEFAFTCCMAGLLLGDATHEATEDAAEWVDLCLASEPGVREAQGRVLPRYKALAAAYFGSDRDAASASSQQIFRDGHRWVSDTAKARYEKDFPSLAPAEQLEILRSISDARGDTAQQNAGTKLFTFLKSEVIKAYYTSRAGLTELDYKGNAYHVRSPGCSVT